LPGALAENARLSTIIYNGDDGALAAFLDLARPSPATSRINYGIRDEDGVCGRVIARGAAGSTIEVRAGEHTVRFEVRGPGEGAVYAALAAVAAATRLGIDLAEIAARLDGIPPEPGRLAPLQGAADRIVLDDTFNASEASLWLALKTLDLFPRPYIAVLGEISGLRRAGAVAEPVQRRLFELDRLVLQGPEMAALGRELRGRSPHPERMLFTYSARDSADAVAGSPQGGTVLVKGSDAARMERVVELLLPEAERQRAALVRQDEGWRRRTYVPNERPTWVEVELDAIRTNLRALQAAAAPAEVLAVLKADAYGHGARWVARTAALNGAAMLGVASLNEALDLRADGITTPILILGYSPPWQARDLALSDIQATVFSLPVAEHIARTAADLGREIGVHIKVDTGLTRLGVLPEDAPAFVDALARLPGLRLEGIFSHMATSDSDVGFAVEQGERFFQLVAELERTGQRFRYVHVENSAAVLRRLPFQGNLVRVGLGLYGLYPLPPAETDVRLQPALAFKTRVAQVKAVPAGTGVSYGRTFVTQRPSRIAVLPVGYGDGFRRSPSNWGHVLVRGRRAAIVGVVAMDMTMIDVTDIDGVQEGDEVVLIGRQGEQTITVEDVAAALGTISYEVVTQILPRVPRQTR
ncbi:MAG TPA: alanine racemase, partial [Dehalococcoidia bacterium]|nr:alanine racemase [Dehalococcoidia bacterium]